MDGLLPIPLKYYGGHTGRWSGTEGINPQNFGTRSKENLVNQVRTIIVPPPDHVLLITDAAQIEARIVNWLAGQWNILDLYASGADPYCKLAAAIIGRPVNKPDSMRQLGKCAELGCGFGMGPTKFMAMAAKPPYNLTVAPHQSEVAIYAYRQTHPKVVTLWYNVERGFKYVAKNPIEKFALPIGVSSHVLFTSLNGVISVRLPSSRVLYYPKIRIRVEQNREELVQLNATDTRKSVRLWGGFLVENIVQAIARDILALAILETDKYGAGIGQRVALSVHDEIVSVAPEKYAAMALDIQLAALRHTPEWAEGLPLNAEGKTAERYEK
jgi:DNA polymerase